MNSADVTARYRRMRAVLNGERADRIPLPGDYTSVEYRMDTYHLGEPVLAAPGEVVVSNGGKVRTTADGGNWRQGDKELYRDHEDVLNAPLDRFEVEIVDERMRAEMRSVFTPSAANTFTMPQHYGTLVTRATLAFDWEPFLLASAVDEVRFAKILDRFGEASLAVISGWSSLEDVEAIRIHDDIASTKGLILSPVWLKKYVFPWYARFFKAVHDGGKKALHISDGNWFAALDDIMEAGADGVYIESSAMDPAQVMKACGEMTIYQVKTDNSVMDSGTPEEIRAELTSLRKLWERYPSIFMYHGGGGVVPENVAAFNRYYNELLCAQ
ncbi:MAG: uroporphyrinogen decarboxylase family protein [Spirochaetota bacterium]